MEPLAQNPRPIDAGVTIGHVHLRTADIDRVRGFYVDFEDVAPGPLLTTSDEVLDALADLPALAARSRQRYARFRAEYCHLDDGHATARALDLLGLRSGTPTSLSTATL